MKRLHIIECDELRPDLKPEYGSYGQMFACFLSAIDPELEIHYHSALDQQLPVPAAGDCFLITGSKAGVYEDHEWIAPLLHWVKQAYQAQAKLLGFCFGHQLLAHALGGQVTKSEKGWGVGVRQLPWQSEPLLNTDTLALIYSHQDQVQQLPDNAEVLAGDDFCPFAAFSIDDLVLGFQGHPEFTAEYTRRLLSDRVERIGRERFEQAMQSLDKPTDAEALGEYLLSWLFQS